MKLKSNCYLMPLSPVFNQEYVPVFENFDKEHSSILWSTLYRNGYEVLSSYPDCPYSLIFDEADRLFLPDNFKERNDIIFGNTVDKETLMKNLSEKYFRKYENNIIMLAASIGYTHQDISKALNLLNTTDDSLVLGRSFNNKISFAGFNTFPDFLNTTSIEYDYILAESCRHNSILYTLDNFMSIQNAADFKKLYQELSKKESLAYCSQEIHEKFTHLFIEYKELLK
ncbi:MAG: hypothetical protein EHM47_16865 [Ignavibacteriales bacterium]|nr:MAG: hypothetical protein EHM47_16865 [Ignavibacteriales bacterium]